MQLAKLRQRKGLTQRELAKELSNNKEGIKFSYQSISLYEIGLREPNMKRAKIIADYFGVTLEELFFGTDARKLKAKEGNRDAAQAG